MPVGFGEVSQVAGQPLVGVAQHGLELLAREVALVAVDGLEPSAVDGQQLTTEEIQLTAEHHEVAKGRFEGGRVLAPKVGDGLEVGAQPAQQPDHLQVAAALRFQPSAGAHAVEVAVQVQLEQVARMVARPPGVFGRRAHEAGLL